MNRESWLRGAVRDRMLWIALLALLVVGLGFLWVPYAVRMWAAGHYQFFPLVFVAVAMLLWTRREELDEARTSPSGTVVAGLLLGVIVMAAMANLLYSSFAGIVATVLAIGTGVYAVFGGGGTRAAAGVLALLVFAIPLPMNLDESLIVRMQLVASDVASRLLDGVGVIHFRQGVILQTENARFLTEEACSGIRSLFASWAVVATIGVAMRHRWWRMAINLTQTVLWVMVGNVLRIAAVVGLAEQAPWLASGWGHELLGLGVFAFILAMVASTDAALSSLISSELVIESRGESPGVPGYVAASDEPVPAIQLPPFPLAGRSLSVVFIALAVLGLVSVRAQWVRSGWASSMRSITLDTLPPPTETDLPQHLAAMERTSFVHTSRGANVLWAQHSYIWEYTREPLRAIISVDTPWNEWHNLDYCYRNIGWETESQFAALPQQESRQAALPGYRHSELVMRRTGQFGLVIFSAIDRSGKYVREGLETPEVLTDPVIFASQAMAALGLGGERANVVTADRLPVSTVQLYAESTVPWTEENLQSLRELFFEARETLVRQRATGGSQ